MKIIPIIFGASIPFIVLQLNINHSGRLGFGIGVLLSTFLSSSTLNNIIVGYIGSVSTLLLYYL